MLRDGELDIYTAAKKTPEREKEFAFSTHPAITSSTCMNVKVGNDKIVAGDYSTILFWNLRRRRFLTARSFIMIRRQI